MSKNKMAILFGALAIVGFSFAAGYATYPYVEQTQIATISDEAESSLAAALAANTTGETPTTKHLRDLYQSRLQKDMRDKYFAYHSALNTLTRFKRDRRNNVNMKSADAGCVPYGPC